ncbi:isoprenylcysteine carboxyl methyltransferase family protein [Sediminibacillus halophilus]|uniref:Methyltransferase n=1 Tax=Sediminibacillus halophilus TaxID=482461 RepID=A0A1G9M1C6_9BACI|nr:isoprenylcysteine carboxylmethyltransferase family protein [Sediminibacillus halophilus]SDL68082.1 methyltransferase [Sediminibacillus halophilus]
MNWWMGLLFVFLILQRLIELGIARSNESWMKEQGAIESGAEHYKWFVLTHSLFFVSLWAEAQWKGLYQLELNIYLFILFVITQLLRIWCIASLGRFWNTKIIILPGANLVRKGPYRFIKHPNYLVVLLELIVIPLMFHTYITAIMFPFLHLLLLRVRIPEEERALGELEKGQ